ncbi:MAG: alkaline phosphatase family protein [Candidatus Nitrosopolaris sp.]
MHQRKNNAPNSVTSTPIKHLVIIFQENVSFDHYFGTYPNATNPPDEPKFIADPHTPSVNRITAGLLNHNPNGNYSINPQVRSNSSNNMRHGS